MLRIAAIVLMSACIALSGCDLLMQGAVGDKARKAEVKQNLHLIQLGVERVWAQTGACPGSLAELTPTMMPTLPTNPFTKKPTRALAPGDPASPGEVVFIPRPDGKGGVGGYLLVAYGVEGNAVSPSDASAYPGADQLDWSKVVITLNGEIPEAP